MASAADRASSAVPPALLSIGQVLSKLSGDFPELTPSKLRFLEEQGLICPARTQSGYRKFSPADVERLRAVLMMQGKRYLPLKVIKVYLDDLDAGRAPELPGGQVTTASILPSERRMPRDELLRDAGAAPGLLSDAVASGLIAPADRYGDEALSVLRSLVELQKSGIEPRHLRSVRASADREIALIENALMPVTRRKDVASRARALEAAREISTHLETVRSSIIRSALSTLDR